MENATNALLMAGSVLIGVIVISLFVYLFSSMGSMTKDFQEEIDYVSVQKFNEQFEKYIGRNDINTHEVLTLYNLVETVNKESAEIGGELINFNGISPTELKDLQTFLFSKQKYECKAEYVKYSTDTGRVISIELKKVKN